MKEINAEKICSKCNKSKPLSEFGKDSRHIDGHRSECRECARQCSNEWRRRNKGKVNERARERAKSDKGRAQNCQRRARWRLNHLVQARREIAQLRAKHPRK